MICSVCHKDYLRAMPDGGQYCFACHARDGQVRPGVNAVSSFANPPLSYELRESELDWVKKKYHLSLGDIRRYCLCGYSSWNGIHTWLMMPVYGPLMAIIGAQFRRLSDVTTDKKFITMPGSPRGMLWFSEYFTHYLPGNRYPTIAICEGICDAIRVAEFIPAVALMGVRMTRLQQQHFAGLITPDTKIKICLDPDAGLDADALSRVWGKGRCDVVLLPDDPGQLTKAVLKGRLT